MIRERLIDIANRPDTDSFRPLGQLLKQLRPSLRDDQNAVQGRIQVLISLLHHEPELLRALQHYFATLLLGRRHTHLYTDIGILSNETVMSGLIRRVVERVLPPLNDDQYIDEAFARLIRRGKDADWICSLPDELLATLISLINPSSQEPKVANHCRLEQLDALRILAYRVCALGLEPELVRSYPAFEAFESPFIALSHETDRFVRQQRDSLLELRSDCIDHKQMQVLMAQCIELVRKLRRHTAKEGVSVSLTYLMVRIEQSLARMDCLLEFLTNEDTVEGLMAARYLKLMCRGEAEMHSMSALLSRNTELMARNITEHASTTGDHYVTHTRSQFLAMWKSAARGGMVVGFMALLKILISKLALAPFSQALLYSLNYSFGFMLIHIMHGTIATKQPAMTASHLAATIEQAQTGKPEKYLNDLATLCIDVFRSQTIAIAGNVGLALPVALLIGFVSLWLGNFAVDTTKAQYLLSEIHPFESLALFHAAIAGFYLFLSGIISGYYDNLAIYSKIPERLVLFTPLQFLPSRRKQQVAAYLRDNLGALAGNFYFGIMLGSTAIFGEFFGLPVDIRHIAFSTANFAYATVALDFQIPLDTLLYSIGGLVLIGTINLSTSFALAFGVALKSRGVRFHLWWPLCKLIASRFMRQPTQFFWPGRDINAAEAKGDT